MKLIIALAVLVSVAVALPRHTPAVHVKDIVSRNSRIIEGSPAALGQFPWQVANNFQTFFGTSFCGGALISGRWVLTAAHCAVDALSFEIFLGTLNSGNGNEPGRVVVNTRDSIVHNQYSSFSLNNDIALVDLINDITFSETIQPIPLGTTHHEAGVELTVSGWGLTSDSESWVSPTLNFVNLVTISNDDCRDVYGISVIDKVVCTKGVAGHQSTCSGDSGGPLVEKVDDGHVHVGVVSFGHVQGCEYGHPNGFTRTSSYLDWIEDNSGVTA